MKKTLTLFLLMMILTLNACSSLVTATPTPLPATELAASMETQIPTSVASTDTVGFTEPDPETWVLLMPAIREYFYYRKKSVIAGNVEALWAHYPGLKDEADFPNGINAEEFFVNNMQGLKPFDGDIFPESYEKIKVKISDEKAEVLTHGMELYLYADETGKFDDSGSEFKIILFLQQQDNQWMVYKTHDISGP